MIKNVIIVAGGSGKRMKADIPKQFMLLRKKPVLMHSIDAFFQFDKNINIVLALPGNQFDYWKELCTGYAFTTPHTLVKGGETRFQSVKNSLNEITSGLVAIHDGVRPLVSQSTIKRTFDEAEINGSAIPVFCINDSVRIMSNDSHSPLNRNNIIIVQTPQVFYADDIKQAYLQDYNTGFTDDATVLESMGKQINLVEGNRENIKITDPLDMLIANALINSFER